MTEAMRDSDVAFVELVAGRGLLIRDSLRGCATAAVAKLARKIGQLGVLAVLAASVVVSGCTTIKPIDLPPENLRAELRNGAVGTPGETMEVVTVDGTERVFEFVEVDQDADVVRGQDGRGELVAVAIDDIVVVRERREARRDSTLLVVGLVLAVVLALVVAEAGNDIVDAIEGAFTPK